MVSPLYALTLTIVAILVMTIATITIIDIQSAGSSNNISRSGIGNT